MRTADVLALMEKANADLNSAEAQKAQRIAQQRAEAAHRAAERVALRVEIQHKTAEFHRRKLTPALWAATKVGSSPEAQREALAKLSAMNEQFTRQFMADYERRSLLAGANEVEMRKVVRACKSDPGRFRGVNRERRSRGCAGRTPGSRRTTARSGGGSSGDDGPGEPPGGSPSDIDRRILIGGAA